MSNQLCHFAINADDLGRAQRFYENVFGWTFTPWGPPGFYQVETGGGSEAPLGALQQRRDLIEGRPATGYECTLGVDDLDAVIAGVEANGGKIVMPRCTITGVGDLIFFEDTEGNVTGAMQYVATDS
jgi:predicted enzyme related to lactoylglutathione lyase